MTDHTFFATTARGIEPLLLDELKSLGANNLKETVLGITFNAPVKVAYKVCLYSRLAHQVLLKLTETTINDQETLYQAVKQINWLEHIPKDGSFRIDVTGKHHTLNNTQFIAQKAKDAICDQFRQKTGTRPNVELKKPDVVIHLHIAKGNLTVNLSLSGDSLHQRGYRLDSGEAPLKETLAAALLIRANWPKQILTDNACLIDPMCGSGTLLIEAAMIAYEIAPGISRTYYGFSGWLKHDQALWQTLVKEATEQKDKNLSTPYTEIKGFDIDSKQIQICQNNIKRAGLNKIIDIKCQSIDQLKPTQINHLSGLIISNPPYGERLLEHHEIKKLLTSFGELLREDFIDWNLSLFSANLDSMKAIGIRSYKKYKLYNARIEAYLLNFKIKPESFMQSEKPLEKLIRKAESHYTNPSDNLSVFINRLKKNTKHLTRWAKRNQINAYRLYDQDIPEYAFAIDIYDKYIHLQEYQAPKTIDPLKAKRRFYEVIGAIKHLLDIPYENIYIKQRQQQKGLNQYERIEKKDDFKIIKEDKAKFYINLTDYLDTGLFIDHRLMRLEVAKSAAKKTLLNLFAYTCSASVLASLYGAKKTTNVDLSNTYLNWGKNNFQLNQISLSQHEFIQADCLKWLKDSKETYDLIFLDPPTFSNSKRMADTLDIQRDHHDLIILAIKHLKPKGKLYFSNNYRRFKLDPKLKQLFECKDISHLCLSEDFKRRPNIHHCFIIEHKV
ncbi:bifunctional 23S rRNA (guanine(2069)-N(7))-methyltransferase RlmK/23S rRNA (guanine(2445)-N(2))-methyltransferase RlmL [Thiotrichales bacterium 19S11-10]|nr:bifunctional 23S rRNA (guanine(2069)-N(7))-methyltransferase RlmK/23S rRNA (guanine(2445)-N(2))-methyltransferase RlmL [Thiotrichales bacterium 19S11-10]